MFDWINPSCRSTQSMGENTESSSQSQVIAESATGVVQGSSTRNRTSQRPRNSATKMFASTFPKSTMSTIEMAVNTKVLRSEIQNTGSSNTSAKSRRPTQSKLGSPPVT